MFPNWSMDIDWCPMKFDKHQKSKQCITGDYCQKCRKLYWLSEIEVPDEVERLLQEMQQPPGQEAPGTDSPRAAGVPRGFPWRKDCRVPQHRRESGGL